MKLILATVAVTLSGCLVIAQAQAQEQAGPITLLCEANTTNGQLLTRTFFLDFKLGTVNGVMAQIKPDSIAWATKFWDGGTRREVILQHKLDRFSGSYREYEDGMIYPAPLPTYMCGKAPAAKF